MTPPNLFTMYKIGVGPSSSHTMGPMLAAREFAQKLPELGAGKDRHLQVTLHGSLAATGEGHGTLRAVVAGLNGLHPATASNESIDAAFQQTICSGQLGDGANVVIFQPDSDIHLELEPLPYHPNGMSFTVTQTGTVLLEQRYYSIGGGAIADANGNPIAGSTVTPMKVPYPYQSAAELLALCEAEGLSIAELKRCNECSWQSSEALSEGMAHIWQVMQDCISRGLTTEGTLPGGLGVKRRAPGLWQQLKRTEMTLGQSGSNPDQRAVVYAMAVNEENAAGGRIVTAPTNGAAGIVPAVLAAVVDQMGGPELTKTSTIENFLLTSSAIGGLFKVNASISGAEVGCQGEVGTAASMAAAGLTAVLGGTVAQIENAAEIAIEHCLGLTCDPIAGLVQVPCIERNGMGVVKAITAARIALAGDGTHLVSLDQAIETMRETGRDMHSKYKETALGGLAVSGVRIPVANIEC